MNRKMTTVNIYFSFNGNCLEAFNFYKQAFGGEFSYVGKFNEMPLEQGQKPLSPDEGNRIMHITLPISAETSLMGSDTGGAWDAPVVAGNNFSVSVNTDKNAEADRLFAALSEGGKVTMPMANTFWGAYFGMFTDKFGINWMVSAEEKMGK
ncbi:MAG: VOC family protein [Breznakibacter sp.]